MVSVKAVIHQSEAISDRSGGIQSSAPMRKDTRKHKHALLGIASLIPSFHHLKMLRLSHLSPPTPGIVILEAGDDDAASER